MDHLGILLLCVGFLIGVILTHLAYKDRIKQLDNKIQKVKTDIVDSVIRLDDRIFKLENNKRTVSGKT